MLLVAVLGMMAVCALLIAFMIGAIADSDSSD
jgi:hypothetical protein